MKNICYLCNGQKLPLHDISPEILKHIAEIHLPLKCNKCSRIFESVSDLCDIGKCCAPVERPPESVSKLSEIPEENMGESLPMQVGQEEDNVDKILTPLSKINMRWRRKSKEFGKIDPESMDPNGILVRQTSTPMQMPNSGANFTDSSSYSSTSIQISSINCMSSCSSESDEFSPPLAAVSKPKPIPITSPQRGTVSRSRPKLPVQATPLRQVMSKSIQRAIAEHGHYRASPYAIQQRKMSFNSTNSSTEQTMSFMKLPEGGGDSPLDLRLSPAIRRDKDDPKDKQMESYHYNSGDLINFDSNIENYVENNCMGSNHIEYERIELIIRRSDIKSESAMTSFKSIFSEASRSGSVPEIQFTPKMVGHNFIKKTISFETPEMENTPGFVLPSGKIDEEDDDGDDSFNDDVFYTPRASPIRVPLTRRASADTIIPIEDDDDSRGSSEGSSKSRTLWNLVSVLSDNLKFKFKKPEFVKRYFSKHSSAPDEYPLKRRRSSSSSGNDTVHTGSQSTPAVKRQKIQARKPISRMTRHMSIN